MEYSVNPVDQSVFDYATGAFFRYDEFDRLTLCNAWMLPPEEIPQIRRKAKDALRRERDRKIRFSWQAA